MSPTASRSVPASNLVGFSQMTTILAYVATKPMHAGAAYRIR